MKTLTALTLLFVLSLPTVAAVTPGRTRDRNMVLIGISAGALFSKPVRGAAKKVAKATGKTVMRVVK